jgi:hypothetical protein
MECKLWNRLYALIRETAQTCRRTRVHFSDAVIVTVFLWAALHDRPVNWACQMRNWRGTRHRPVQLPSATTMSRRLGTPSVCEFQVALERRVRGTGEAGLVQMIDGKSLTVGGCSEDPDARSGRAASGMGRGYKLYAIWGQGGTFPEVWDVRSLNVNEVRVAYELVPRLTGEGYLLGDTQYDSNRLYDLCWSQHRQLIAPRRKTAKALGHGYQSPLRRHALDLLTREFGQKLWALRTNIERLFGNSTSFGGGLAPLPAWVRRLHRVKRWVWAKLLINANRIQLNQRLTA